MVAPFTSISVFMELQTTPSAASTEHVFRGLAHLAGCSRPLEHVGKHLLGGSLLGNREGSPLGSASFTILADILKISPNLGPADCTG